MNLFDFYAVCNQKELSADQMADAARKAFSRNTVSRYGGIKRMKYRYAKEFPEVLKRNENT